MIKGVFNRLFGNFREGAVLHAKFTVGGGGGAGITFAIKTIDSGGRQVSSYNGLSMARTAVGVGTISLKDSGSPQASSGARDIAVLAIKHMPATPGTLAGYFELVYANLQANLGTVDFRPTSEAGGAFAEFAMANGDEVHVTFMVHK